MSLVFYKGYHHQNHCIQSYFLNNILANNNNNNTVNTVLLHFEMMGRTTD